MVRVEEVTVILRATVTLIGWVQKVTTLIGWVDWVG